MTAGWRGGEKIASPGIFACVQPGMGVTAERSLPRLLQCRALAPDFSLPDVGMEKVGLSGFQGVVVVLYFYPRDDTLDAPRRRLNLAAWKMHLGN